MEKVLSHIERFLISILKETQFAFYKYKKDANTKILGYWNFNHRGETLGDYIIFLQDLCVLQSKYCSDFSKKNIDICFTDDKKYADSKNLYTAKTYMWKKNLKALNVLNPYIDSIFEFSSDSEFKKFYAQNRERYIRWPSEFFLEAGDVKIIDTFYRKNKYLSHLTLLKEILHKIYLFYENNIYPSQPIVLNIRKNTREPERNSNLKELKIFLKHYETKSQYKFIIICEKIEIPEEFRELKNVVFSKDYFNSIEFDLGFIQTSYLSIFPSSGLSICAWFCNVPFIHYGQNQKDSPYIPRSEKQFSFFQKYQRHYEETATAEWLISKFEDLVSYLNKIGLDNCKKNKVKDEQEYISDF